MKKKKILIYIIIISIVCIISNIVYYRRIAYGDKYEKENSILTTDRIYDGVRVELEKPIIVSKTMADNWLMKDFLIHEMDYSKNEAIPLMQSYLMGLNEVCTFDSIFIISDYTKRYYTDMGLSKIVDTEKDTHDIWYDAFIKSENDMLVEVDVDENNDDQLTVFVDSKIYDKSHNVIGVCGVGITVKRMQELLKQYEDSYKVKISLVDDMGLVQLDVNEANIKALHIENGSFKKTDDYQYEKVGINGYSITRYMEEADWFLIVDKDNEKFFSSGFDYTFLIASLIVYITTVITGVMILGRREQVFGYGKGADNEIDGLTGLPNRNFFKNIYGERGVFNTTIYKSMVVFDIDYFKEANDTLEGNDVLVNVVELAKESFGDKGEIFRWGGDEFVVLSEWSVEFGHEICKEFCKKVAKEGRVTVSVGITEVRLADKIKKNYHRATQACYLVKEMGGDGVKRN
ncbi:MAG: GGDEF domain-containing protein [Lachnospiraceae bacterium]|jgi:diguanylate cyclase (GGDEF)-like protein|nr:GGDEF domain-containing protein [Lachnospiraceae bacterium]